MAVGATLGPVLDLLHSHFGALSYPHPVFAGTAGWVPLLYCGAYATGIARPLLSQGEAPPAGWKVALGMGLFVLAYALTVAPWPLAVRWLGARAPSSRWPGGWRSTPWGLLVAGVGALGGPAVEITLVHAGAFVHHEVFLFGVPAWLPLLYLTAAVGLGGLAGRWLAAPGRLAPRVS